MSICRLVSQSVGQLIVNKSIQLFADVTISSFHVDLIKISTYVNFIKIMNLQVTFYLGKVVVSRQSDPWDYVMALIV